MSCISVILGKPNTGDVVITPTPIGEASINTKPIGWFDIDVLNKTPTISASKVGNVKLNIYLICRVGTNRYLRVTPTEVQYIWVDNSIDYNIQSNTNWYVN